MARYANSVDVRETLATVTEDHLLDADKEVDLVLAEKGIDPADIELPQSALTLLAVAFASQKACEDGAIVENSPLTAKARSYERQVARISKGISKASLGLVAAGAGGLGSISIGRR